MDLILRWLTGSANPLPPAASPSNGSKTPGSSDPVPRRAEHLDTETRHDTKRPLLQRTVSVAEDLDRTQLDEELFLNELTQANGSAISERLQSIIQQTTALNFSGRPGASEKVSDDFTKHLMGLVPKLTRLDLSNCPSLTDGTLEVLALSEHLQHLKLNGCAQITDLGLQRFLQKLGGRGLLTLEVGNCPYIKHPSIIMATVVCEDLASLSLDGNCWIDDTTLNLIGGERKTTKLDATSVHPATYAILCAQNGGKAPAHTSGGNCAERLKRLSLRSCPNISAHGIQDVLKHSRNLKKLDIRGCPQITEEQISFFNESFPQVTIHSDLPPDTLDPQNIFA